MNESLNTENSSIKSTKELAVESMLRRRMTHKLIFNDEMAVVIYTPVFIVNSSESTDSCDNHLKKRVYNRDRDYLVFLIDELANGNFTCDIEKLKHLNIDARDIIEIERIKATGLKLKENNPFYFLEKIISGKHLEIFVKLVDSLLSNKNEINVEVNSTLFELQLKSSLNTRDFGTGDLGIKQKGKYFWDCSSTNKIIAEDYILMSEKLFSTSKDIEKLNEDKLFISKKKLIDSSYNRISLDQDNTIKLASEYLLTAIEHLVKSVNFFLLSQHYHRLYYMTATGTQEKLDKIEQERLEDEYDDLSDDSEEFDLDSMDVDLNQIEFELYCHRNRFDDFDL